MVEYFQKEQKKKELNDLLKEVVLEAAPEETDEGSILKGKVFVITGTVEQFANRNELKAFIEERGGKVTGSVSAKTTYLINNDTTSGSSKNKKARELGIPVLSEQDFLNMLEVEDGEKL